jgi:hypothetical protein
MASTDGTEPVAAGIPDTPAISTTCSDATAEACINLRILSPTLPTGPLIFNNLPAATTVAQLKAKITTALSSQPTPANQRLIYLGRLLRQDDDTLSTVFGAETIRDSDKQTIHLIVRRSDDQMSTSVTPVRGRSPAAPVRTNTGGSNPIPSSSQHPLLATLRPRAAAPSPSRANTTHNPFPNPSPAPSNLTPIQAAQVHAQQHQAMSQWIQQLHRQAHVQHQQAAAQHALSQHAHSQHALSQHAHAQRTADTQTPQQMLDEAEAHLLAMTRTLTSQNPRERAAPGVLGQSHHSTNSTHQHPSVGLGLSNPASGRGSPSPSNPVALPPGTLPAQPRVYSPLEMQNMRLRADAQILHRSASAASLPPIIRPSQPTAGATPTMTQPLLYRAPSRVVTPDLMGRAYSRSSMRPASTTPHHPYTPNSEVYILWSPEGPHSLLISNSETYTTSRMISPPMPGVRILPRQRSQQSLRSMIPRDTTPIPSPAPQLPNPAPQAPQNQDQPAAANPEAPAQPRRRHRRHRDRGAGAGNDGQINVWNHVWVVVRLAVFFWVFGLPTALWSRVGAITLIGVFILYNIGVLDGPADQFWAFIRRHVDALLPRPEPVPHPPQQQQLTSADATTTSNEEAATNAAPSPDAAPTPTNPAQAVDPDPARMAARLVAQRRLDNSQWILNTVRRLERLSLLFLASIYPGIAERHIANIEREERAAQRLRDEAAAAAAAAATAAAAAAVAAEVAAEDIAAQAAVDTGLVKEDADGASNAAAAGNSEPDLSGLSKTAVDVSDAAREATGHGSSSTQDSTISGQQAPAQAATADPEPGWVVDL